MPSPRRPPAHLLLVCLFASFQQVSPKTFLLCGISLCSGERCCDGQCCRRYHGLQQEPINGFGLVFIFTGIIMGGICLAAAYKCIKACSALHEREGVEPAQTHVPPAPPGPPSQHPQEDPPPYSEVASKPFLYPLPAIPPPCYSNVVLADAPEAGVNPQTAL